MRHPHADNSKKRGRGPANRGPRHNRVVRVAILGPLEVHDDDGAVVAVAGARLRGLIARLALAGGQPVSTGALAEAVWDWAPPTDAANALQTLVSRARRALGGASAVEQSAAGYRLAVSPDDVDALRFERLVTEGAIAEALALWRGPALADAGNFAEPFARRLDDLRLEAQITYLTGEIDGGRAAASVGELEALVAEHPLHEQLTGLLMRALAATGQQAKALAAYEALRAAAAEAVARFRALGERWGLSSALRTSGNVKLLDGDVDGAVAAYTEAGSLLAELEHREDMSQVQLKLAEIAARQGDLARARELSAAARSAAESSGSPIDRGVAAAWWAAFEVTWGDVEAARPLHAETVRLLARFSPGHPVRDHLEAMVAATGAAIAIADDDVRGAREQVELAYRSAVAAQDMQLLALASGALAEFALALGRPEQAAELLGARTVVRGGDDPTDPATVKLAPRLRAALGAGRYARAYQSGKALSRQEAIEFLNPSAPG
jgi:DNA-binding SARP family transcriptional activator